YREHLASGGGGGAALRAEKPETMPISDLLRRYPLEVLLALGISIISNASFYILVMGCRTSLNANHQAQGARAVRRNRPERTAARLLFARPIAYREHLASGGGGGAALRAEKPETMPI